MWLHKNFNDGGFDLALLELDQPFSLNSDVAAVRLPTKGTILNDNDCRLIGRGTDLGGGFILTESIMPKFEVFNNGVFYKLVIKCISNLYFTIKALICTLYIRVIIWKT